MKREPLKPKQKLLVVVTAFCVTIPGSIVIFRYSSEFSPRQMAVIGALNMLIGVPLLALISEKWIRKMK
jgi:hypothetical protein